MTKPYNIVVKNLDGWWSAVCQELCVSGFGNSESEAIDSVIRSMCSTLEAQASSLRKDPNNLQRMAEIQTVS